MKHSLSLSDDVGERLRAMVRAIPEATPSILADLALKQLLDRPTKEISTMLTRYKLDRKAATREWWQRSFWLLLAESMATFDPINNPYVARDYEDHYLVMLRSSIARDDYEDDPFYVHLGPRAGTDGPTRRWDFKRETSPVQAAEEVARELKRLGVTMDYEGRINKVRQILAERLGSHPPDRFGNAQFHPAMLYGADGERGMMVWNILRLDTPTHPRQDVQFLWRSSTATQMADFLVNAYEKLMSSAGSATGTQ
jgi:hypothetical protein